MFTVAVELGLIYAIMAMGIFITYRILNIPDLTVDGSFALGAAVSAVFAVNGNAVLGIILGTLAGLLAGAFTAFLHTACKIQPILAGILTMTALYSINLKVMGSKPNISIPQKQDTVFTFFQNVFGKHEGIIFLSTVIVVVLTALIVIFFKTKLGLSIRATGDNEDMVRSSSINTNVTKFIAISFANALVGLSGALIAQQQRFTTNTIGTGMVVIGIASLTIGEVIFGRRNILMNIISVIAGAVVYRIIISFVLSTRFDPEDLKLISAVIIIIAMVIPVIKSKIELSRQKHRKEGGEPNA